MRKKNLINTTGFLRTKDLEASNLYETLHATYNLQVSLLWAKREINYTYACKVIPALKLLADSLDKSFILTEYLKRLVMGLKRQTAQFREPVKKAAELPLDTIRHLVCKELTELADTPGLINPINLRTLFRITVEYFLHCRFQDFSRLEARHFLLTESGIEVTFPGGKNDQMHQGSSSTLVANGLSFCPVQITKLFFQREGFLFANDGSDHSKVNCRIRKNGGSWVFQPTQVLGRTTAIEQLRKLLAKYGFPFMSVTDKSAKMEGVTQSLDAGVPLEEVQLHGRWETLEMPMRYKRNSSNFKLKIEANVPY